MHTSDCKPYLGSLDDELIILLSQADTNQEMIEAIITHVYTDDFLTDGKELATEFDFLVKFQGDEDNYWIPYEELQYTTHLREYIRLNASKFKDVKF